MEIRGMKDNKFNSNPIHVPNHVFDETVIKVPIINDIRNINL